MTLKLKSAKIKNFKSLGDINLSFRNLTIIVGSNSSGKSNSLEALEFLKDLLVKESLPDLEAMHRFLRFSKSIISYDIAVEDEDRRAEYSVSVTLNKKNTLIARENLKVGKTKVIKVIKGEGEVSDEDGENSQKYQSEPENLEGLALRSAGNFGNKPFTKKLASYIRNWEFYDIDPAQMRRYSYMLERFKGIYSKNQNNESVPSLDDQASEVQEVLNYLVENENDKFEEISKELQSCLNVSLVLGGGREQIVKVLEGNGKEMPLTSMSDGTLRLIAYFILLYQSEIPPLIGIEEPERNLHPGILKEVASIMKRLSKRTQVVFTTHSSQLLDCFNPDEISSEISIILLSKKDDFGTKSFLLDKLAENRNDLLEWMSDFGLGSAIYHSHLLQEILGI